MEPKDSVQPGSSARETTRLVKKGDPEYPVLLAHITGAPKILYYRGDLSVLNGRTIALVGARKATDYGRWAATTLARHYGEQGVIIVSGMAEGIDTCAHMGALESGAPTVAVMGCGLDICYPSRNERLRGRILDTGLLLSEYPDGTHPDRYTFPARNRIISGVSLATVVVEAGLKSGSLITADFAVSQGREVYAVPGNINRAASIGCNKLIQDGARPLAFLDDVLTDFGIHRTMDTRAMEGLGADEKLICEAIQRHGELSVNDVSRLITMPVSKVTGLVTVLEMKGILCNYSGKIMLS